MAKALSELLAEETRLKSMSSTTGVSSHSVLAVVPLLSPMSIATRPVIALIIALQSSRRSWLIFVLTVLLVVVVQDHLLEAQLLLLLLHLLVLHRHLRFLIQEPPFM